MCMNYLKGGLSVLLGGLATFFDQYATILIMVAAAIVFDFFTGLIKAKINGTMSSKKGTAGLWKKIITLLALFFGIFLDFFFPLMLQAGINITIPFNLPFGLIVGVYIIINEGISILENFSESGVNMPPRIKKLFKNAKDHMNKDDGEK